MGRPDDFEPLVADEDAEYDEEVRIELDTLVPLVAQPHMPDRVVPVAELAGLKVDQAAIGSCTNSSYADLKSVALLFKDRQTCSETDTLISPGSRQVLKMLAEEGLLETLMDAGARILECSCGPCIGIGGSPVSKGVSVRTFNRNFEGRSGTRDAGVYLASPLTAAMAALQGSFTDPAGWGTPPVKPTLPAKVPDIKHLFIFPPEDGSGVEVERGPNIAPLGEFESLPEVIRGEVILKAGDNITTDHILPGGAEIMSLRSNIPAISEHVFAGEDRTFPQRIKAAGGGVVVGGENYGQGSSREHAALAPRYLGVSAVIALSMARIHRANLVNFGILPLHFESREDYDKVKQGEAVSIPTDRLTPGGTMEMEVEDAGTIRVTNDLTEEELAIIRAGGMLNYACRSRK